MKSLKSLSIFFLLLVTGYWSLITFTSPALAQTPTPPPVTWVDETTPENLRDMIQSEELSSATKTTYDLNVITVGLQRMVIGDPVRENVGGNSVSRYPGGALGGVTSLIASMYANPPASGVEYVADLGRNLGVVAPVYAQTGVGFGGLKPILSIWKAFRDVAYLFFIVIFVITGFAIMFRMKISPQAVMTIQSAIPRVVIALILVTFSYAIAGFLIDLMYVALTLGIAALGTGDLFDATEIVALQEQFISGGFPNTIGALLEIIPMGAWNAFGVFGALLGGIIGTIVPIPVISTAVGAGIGVGLMWLIMVIIVLYAALKLFFELLKTYIGIIFAVILGPLQILLGVLPGQSGIGKWLMGLVANLMVFPAVAMILLIGRLLTREAIKFGDLWSPPMMAETGTGMVPALIGLGIMLMMPKIPEMVKQAFGQKPAGFGTAIGEALGPVLGPVKYVTGMGRELGTKGALGYTAAGVKTSLARKFGKVSEETSPVSADDVI